jgi:N-acetylglucosaminyldiphosphoundecaprenol N-acetyl-beta-D-mannosaminyltransferase
MTPPVITILSVPVHVVRMDEALAWAAQAVAARVPRQVCTVNPEFIMAAQGDPGFRRVLAEADLNIADGGGLLWAARRQGATLPERVAGVDFVERLAALAAQQGWRLYLLGAAEGVAARVAEILCRRYPGLQIAGVYAGSPRPEDADSIVARIRAARPDLLLVAYGAPAQDKWIAQHRQALGVPVSIGVGGTFDFIAGVARRAPGWVQRLGLEWLHRLLHQPWRARRMWVAVVEFPIRVMLRE